MEESLAPLLCEIRDCAKSMKQSVTNMKDSVSTMKESVDLLKGCLQELKNLTSTGAVKI